MYNRLQKEEFGYRKGKYAYKHYTSKTFEVNLIDYNYFTEDYKKVYLIFYNLFQCIGFIYVLSVMGIRYYRDGSGL